MIIAGRYQVIKELGAGGMARTYLTLDKTTGKQIAIKKPLIDSNINQIPEKHIKRWQSEIAAMSKIIHKNIVEIYDYKFGPKPSDYYIAMEYVKGFDLDKIIQKRVFLDQKEAVDYVIQILDAVDFLNKKGILHRDLKPANIMVKSSGEIKLCDLGLAKAKNFSLNITSTTAVAGTQYYMAPEILFNYSATIQSEIYSIGIILFELLTGSKPFKESALASQRAEAERSVKMQISDMPLPNVKNIAKEVPQALENAVIKATAKLPNERHSSFQEFKKDLETAFDKSRQFEQKLVVVNKFKALFDHDDSYDDNLESKGNLRNLPFHVKIFIIMLLLTIIGVVVFYAR